MLAKVKEGLILGIGISLGMLAFQIAINLLSLVIALLLGLAGATGM